MKNKIFSRGPCVSVILTVYNTEPYLRKCLDSIVNQTLKNIEIICVDDGSTDGSLQLLKQYQRTDERIIIIEQENMGAGAARNAGLSVAKGEYLSILDSDDFFDLEMLEKSYKAAKANHAEIVVFQADFYNHARSCFEPCNYSLRTDRLPDKNPFSAKDISDRIFNIGCGWAWDKLFKHSFVENCNIRFQEIRTTNDMLFVFYLYSRAERIYFLNRVLAHQRINAYSSLSVTREKSWNNFYLALSALKERLVADNTYERYRHSFVNWTLNFTLWNIDTLELSEKRQLISKCRLYYFKELDVLYNNEEYFIDKTEFERLEKYMNEGKSIKVSVIIPVYNGDRYLRECLDSVCGQSLEELQIICVNDGSTDKTADILREYAERDSRIMVVTKEHTNAGESRNAGLEYAEGKYLSFLDADDFFDSNMLRSAYEAAERDSADICAFRCNMYDESNGNYVDSPWTLKLEEMPGSRPFSNHDCADKIFTMTSCTAWDKLFNREFILRNQIRFQSVESCNDMLFTYSALSVAGRITTIDVIFAHYRINQIRTLAKDIEYLWHNFYDSLMALKEFLTEARLYSTFKKSFENWAIDFSIWNMHNYKEVFRDHIRQALKRHMFDDLGLSTADRNDFFNQDLYNQMRAILDERVIVPEGERPKVSIIIPTYNVEPYLRICLDSAIYQTLENIEIIVVNDGSTDNCLEIIKEYAARDKRIIVIDKENGGYGKAMNCGLDRATGEYIGIIEPDDFVDIHMFEDLYNIAKANELDFVKADFFRFTHDDYGNLQLAYNKIAKEDINYNTIMTPGDEPACFRFILNTWSGIYKRSFLESHAIRHNETPGASFQDNGFWFQTFIFAQKAMFVNRPYYMNRRDNPNSSVMSPTKVWCMKNEYDHIRTILENNQFLLTRFCAIYQISRFRNYMFNYNRISNIYKLDFAKHFGDEYRKAMENGELRRDLFLDNEWEKINRLIDDPQKFVEDDLTRRIYVSFILLIDDKASITSLKSTLNSLTAQTLSKIEFVCVLNGSCQKAHTVLKEYSKTDNRIIIIQNTDTEETGSAYSIGIQYAFGKYYSFVKVGEELKLTAAQSLYNNAEKNQADVVRLISRDEFDHYDKYINETTSINSNRDVFIKWEENLLYKIMVRRTFIEDRKIAFDDINKYYDYPFYLNCIIRNYKIFLIDYKSVTDAIPEETYQQVFDSNLLSEWIKAYKSVSVAASTECNETRSEIYQIAIERIISEFEMQNPFDPNTIIIFKEFFIENQEDINFIKETSTSCIFKHWYKVAYELISLSYDEFNNRNGRRFDLNQFRKTKLATDTLESAIIEEDINSIDSEDEEIFVSAIIAVDEDTPYISSCIDSILSQSLQNIEVICIASGVVYETLRRIAAFDKRVRIIKKANPSKGNSYNLGLYYAKGKYVSILSPSDFLLPNMYETLYQKAKKDTLDIIKSDYSKITRTTGYGKPVHIPLSNDKSLYNGVIVPYSCPNCTMIDLNVNSGLYRTDFIRQKSIRFNEESTGSYVGEAFSFMAFVEAEKCMFIREPLYMHYVPKNKSNKNDVSSSISEEYKFIYQELEQNFVNKERYLSNYQKRKFNAYYSVLLALPMEERYDYLKYIHHEFVEENKKNSLLECAFTNDDWNTINHIIRDPDDYYYSVLKKRIKVSVILPVYNVANYLSECLESFLSQSLKDIEIICINDGSTDNSAEIVKKYMELDDRIILIEQDNGGAGKARNVGISVSNGEYLYFPDADDYVEPNLLEKTYKAIRTNDADICIFASSLFDYKTREKKPCTFSIRNEMLPKKKVFSLSEVNGNEFKVFMGWAWDKLYRKDFVINQGLRFQEQRTTNDMYFAFISMFKASRITVVNESLYNQRRNNPNSLSSTRYLSWQCFYNALNKVRSELVSMGVYDRYKKSFINYALHSCLWNLNTLPQEQANLLCNKLRDEWFSSLDIIDYGKEFYESSAEYNQLLCILNAQSCDGCSSYFDYKMNLLKREIADLKSPRRKIKISNTETRTEEEVIEKLKWNRKQREALEEQVEKLTKQINELKKK